MIKIVRAEVIANHMMRLEFSDGSMGEYNLEELIRRNTEMVRPLADPDYFAGFFLELGALCWPNGFALSAPGIHRRLSDQGVLKRVDAA